jgi:hypothetical protein
MTVRRLALVATLALAACGKQEPLRPAPGMSAVPKAAAAAAPATPDQLTTPEAQARPERNVELLTRSQERTADPFDLPPPSNAAY